jgi:hypothetical protein
MLQLAVALLDIGALADREPGDGSLAEALDRFLDAVGDPSFHGLLEIDPEPLAGALVVVLTRLVGELADALGQGVAETVESLRPLIVAQLGTC